MRRLSFLVSEDGICAEGDQCSIRYRLAKNIDTTAADFSYSAHIPRGTPH